MLWEGMGFGWAETAYSGVTFPLVEPGLEHAAKLGYRRIVVFPYFLFTGILGKRIYEHTDRVAARHPGIRSEEHTSELQSLMRISYAVFCLKNKHIIQYYMNSRT